MKNRPGFDALEHGDAERRRRTQREVARRPLVLVGLPVTAAADQAVARRTPSVSAPSAARQTRTTGKTIQFSMSQPQAL